MSFNFWLQSLSTVLLEPKKIKSATVSIFSPSTCHWVMGLDAMIFFWGDIEFSLLHTSISFFITNNPYFQGYKVRIRIFNNHLFVLSRYTHNNLGMIALIPSSACYHNYFFLNFVYALSSLPYFKKVKIIILYLLWACSPYTLYTLPFSSLVIVYLILITSP